MVFDSFDNFKNPFFGYGFDTYYLHKYDVFPYYIVDVPHPHNTYLRAIQELGLIWRCNIFLSLL
ncbi:MAG: O-antigen ligase family protein [Ignavibacteria bacterium]|nr:O-antigen ligase family protein [Ignavibacteria bacterium]